MLEGQIIDQLDEEKIVRIKELMPVLDKRYKTMQILLEEACDVNDKSETQILLAYQDLQAVVKVMMGNGLNEESED